MRLRTLPVSIAGVIAGLGCSVWQGTFKLAPAIICLLFAILAQIASNFGNEYYDFKNGLDKKGREGFRRGVTEGDITPGQMEAATFTTLAIACIIGCMTLLYGPWWLLPLGIVIALAAIAYSAGPYPLSHHGLGDIAVIIFFGIIPVTLTCFLQTGDWRGIEISLPTSIAVGLIAANVLIVNNYRDMEDDKAAGKHTTVVIYGRHFMSAVYLCSGIAAMAIMTPIWLKLPLWAIIIPIIYLILHVITWHKVTTSTGAALNPLLGRTAMNLMIFSILLTLAFIL